MKPLYVAATGQHVGKTTSTLGLVTNIVEHGFNVGYCKPVGQQHLYVEGQMIDKDVTLFSQILGFKIDGSLHSPVVMARGVTKKYIDNPSQFQFRDNIINASKKLNEQHEMVVYEGTGHPGVGSVGLDLMGVLPFDKRLSFPMMETVTNAIKGTVLFNNDQLDNRVEDIVAGSLVAINEFNNFKNILLVVSFKRLDEAIEKVKLISTLKNLSKTPISGIIITGDGLHETGTNVSETFKSYVEEHQIPVIATDLDTYGSVVKISRIEVKINTRTPWKTQRAIELIRENVNVSAILEKLKD